MGISRFEDQIEYIKEINENLMYFLVFSGEEYLYKK